MVKYKANSHIFLSRHLSIQSNTLEQRPGIPPYQAKTQATPQNIITPDHSRAAIRTPHQAMTTPYKTVALAGASGALGAVLLNHLLKANYTVTALTRPGITPTFPPSVKTAEIDYSSPSTLRAALADHDVLISTVGYAGILAQEALISAALAVGVKRIIPSEYGSDPSNAAARALPVFGHKVQIEQHLRAAVTDSPTTTWTLVANNEFLDWDLDHGFGVDVTGRKMEIFDGGDVPFTATPLSFVAEGVVRILQRPELTANRVVKLHGAKLTQSALLRMLQKHTGTSDAEWTLTRSSTAEREKQGYEALAKDPQDFAIWAVMFLQCAVWGSKFGNDFSAANDNEVLGLRALNEGEVEEIVKARC